MKDTIVTARRKKTELITLLVCFVVSNLLHLYAIIAFAFSSKYLRVSSENLNFTL